MRSSQSAGSPLEGLRAAMRDDTILQELAVTPLMLSILSLTYFGKSLDEMRAEGAMHPDRIAALRFARGTICRFGVRADQWRIGLFAALCLALPALARWLSPLALRAIYGLRRRAYPVRNLLLIGALIFSPPFSSLILRVKGKKIVCLFFSMYCLASGHLPGRVSRA
jgi:hypothetical protein